METDLKKSIRESEKKQLRNNEDEASLVVGRFSAHVARSALAAWG